MESLSGSFKESSAREHEIIYLLSARSLRMSLLYVTVSEKGARTKEDYLDADWTGSGQLPAMRLRLTGLERVSSDIYEAVTL